MKSPRLLLILIPGIVLMLGFFVVTAGAMAFYMIYLKEREPEPAPLVKNDPPPKNEKSPAADAMPPVKLPTAKKPAFEEGEPEKKPEVTVEQKPEPKEIKAPPLVQPKNPMLIGNRVNPEPLTINKGGPEHIQLDYVPALVFTHDYQADLRTLRGLVQIDAVVPQPKNPPIGGVGGPPPARLAREVKAYRMIVCTAVFPMVKQVDDYCKALHYKTHHDLLSSPLDLPRPLGINVKRFELLPNGKRIRPEGEILIQYDPAKRELILSKPLQALLRDAFYDEEVAGILEPYLFEGLAMPIPKLARTGYPNIELRDIDVAPLSDLLEGPMPKGGPQQPKFALPGLPKGKGPPLPPLPGVGPEENPFKLITLKEPEVKRVDFALAERLFHGKFNVFHALGQFRAEKGPGSRYFSSWHIDAAANEGRPKGPAPIAPKNWNRDALVRFVDPEAEPGKSYEYAIQVRLANPNFGKKDAVKNPADAEPEELPLDPVKSWVVTQPFTVPSEYHLYVVNQPLLDDRIAGGKPKFNPVARVPKDHARLQVHRWVGTAIDKNNGDTLAIGDWLIAERIDVKRGEPIGLAAAAPPPVWRKHLDRFDLPKSNPLEAKKPKKAPGKPANALDLLPTPGDPKSAPVLVDFTATGDEGATEAIILMPDGRRVVLRSNLPVAEEHERQLRLSAARRRLDDVSQPMMPIGVGPLPPKK